MIVDLRQRARGNISAVMVVWAVVMTVIEVSWELRAGRTGTSLLEGGIASALLGVYLGWRRRVGATVVAPAVNWLLAWFPLWIAAMVRHGLISGLVVGLVLVTLGWLILSAVEIVWIGFVALVVRSFRGRAPEEPSVTIIPPR